MSYPNVIESLDPEDIASAILMSGERLGGAPARRRWARAIVRKIASGQSWEPAVVRALYLSARAEPRVPAAHRSMVTSILMDVRWLEAFDVAKALADGDIPAWVRATEYAPLVYALRCTIEAHFRLGEKPTFDMACAIALEAVEKRRLDLVRGLLVDDVVRLQGPGAKTLATIASVCSGADRDRGAVRHLVPGHHGILAACVYVASYPTDIEASVADGWQGMLAGLTRKRIEAEGGVGDLAHGYAREWRRLAKERAASKGLRGLRHIPPPDEGGPAIDPLTAAQEADAEYVARPMRLCVPKLPEGRNRDAPRSAVAGRRLPVVVSSMSAILDVRQQLLAEFPWLEDVVRPIVGQLFVAAGSEVRIRPTIVVGPPGCGKSRLVRRLAGLLQVPSVLIDGTHDDAGPDLVGTSARWSSAQPTAMALAFERHRTASLVVLVDEIDKATSRRNRGHTSLWDALLTLLEPSTAGRVPDKCLGVDIDASGVSWVMTANDLTGLPDPFFDRVQVLRAQAPGREHVPALAQALADDVMRSRGYPDDEIPPLDELEIRLVARTWKGGSVRQLQRIVERMVDARMAVGRLTLH